MARMWLYLNYLEESLEADLAAARAKVRTVNTSARLKSSAFNLLSDEQFLKRYRLTKELTQQLISDLIPHIPPTLRPNGLDIETKVLVALAYYATGSQQNMIGDSRKCRISPASVYKAIREVTLALNKPDILEKYITFPFEIEERNQIKERFYRKFNIPGLLGCVDRIQVSIVQPKEDEKYYNKNGYYSINATIICDSDLNILSADVSNPGSRHDSVVWDNHLMNAYIGLLHKTSKEDLILLGNANYPLSPTLMTPLSAPEPDTPEAHYQELHSNAMSVAEECLYALKSRFRCLLAVKRLNYLPEACGKIVNACFVLHNIANKAQLPFEPLTKADRFKESFMTRNTDGAPPVDVLGARALVVLEEGRAKQHALIERLWVEREIKQE